jgi:hypothetical protein
MAHAYTPGLRVTPQTRLVKERRLPLRGQVLVSVGDLVQRDQVVARTEMPGDVVTVNLVNRLGITPQELPRYMLKKEGDAVAAGEPLAETHPLIKWFKTVIKSDVDGVVESISPVTGQVILRRPPAPVEITAYVDGVVVDTIEDEGVYVEVQGALIQGIFGVGGERWGTLHQVATSRDQDLLPDQIDSACDGRIVVGGGLVTSDAITRAAEVGAVAVIGGGIRDGDLRDLLGYDLGVAITGSEDIGVSVIITEGFGKMAMAPRTFDILSSCNGREASVSGATQIRAGVLRPEIIVPNVNSNRATVETDDNTEGRLHQHPGEGHQGGLVIGDPLRVIRAPYFGRIGMVDELIADLQQIETEARVRVLRVKFEDGSTAVVPRANVELIEE